MRIISSNGRLVFAVTSGRTARNFLKGYLGFLRNAGWDVSLISQPTDGIEEFAEAEGVDFIPIAWTRNPSLLRDLGSLIRLYRQLRQLRPDVVVGATPKAGLLLMLAAKFAGVPQRIYLLWGLRFETARGFARWILMLLERLTSRSATLVLSNSRSLRDAAVESGTADPRRTFTVAQGSSHGVDLHRFSENAADVPGLPKDVSGFLSANADAFVLAFIGRIHLDKGIETLLRAIELVRDQGEQVVLLIVGSTESKVAAMQVETAVATGFAYFGGAVSDIRPYAQAAHALCLPSLREGFPNVVLEAAAMKTPALVSDATGAVDSVIDGQTGILFPVGDVQALATAISALAADQGLVERLGVGARAWVEENFEESSVWQAYAEYFLDGHPNAHK